MTTVEKAIEAGRCSVAVSGALLKDPDVVVGYHTGSLEGIQIQRANAPLVAPADVDAIRALLRS